MTDSCALVQINCAPQGNDGYPLPKTMYIIRHFATLAEGKKFWPQDLVHHPPQECPGQCVYQLLWNMSEPLNLDRFLQNDNVRISNTAMWLPDDLKQMIVEGKEQHIPVLTKTAKKQAFTVIGTQARSNKPGGTRFHRPLAQRGVHGQSTYLPPNPKRPL